MSALDTFLGELRAACAGNPPPELERLEDCLRVLRSDDSDAAVADYDRLVKVARQPMSLAGRLQAMMLTMQTGQ